jgi:hypothetical protein
MMRYQTLRSVSDNPVFVVCRDGGFYDLPDHVGHRGPRQGMHRGEIANWLELDEHGYVHVRCELAGFKPEV